MNDTSKYELRERVVKEKVLSAETYSAYIRLVVVIINTVAYMLLMDKTDTHQGLAYTIIVSALLYGFYVVFFKPYEKHSLFRTSVFTFFTDGVLTALWIVATGYSESPFYLLWYVNMIAVGQRFSFKETITTSLIYVVLYVIILRIDVGAIATAELFLRVLYIPIVGAFAAFFAREFESQVEDKLKAKQSELEALRAQEKLNESLEALRAIQKELEKRVEERTHDLSKLNKELKSEVKEKENVQKEQKRTLESLARINAELESFAYVTSHDLKAPLRGIATIAQWLKDDYADKLDEGGRDQLDLMQQRVQRMNDLIEGILQYSRVGRVDEKVEMVDVKKAIDESAALLMLPKSANISVNGEFPLIEINSTLLLQVLDNLLSNAHKYGAKKNCEIRVEGRSIPEGWEVSVADNGKGIAVKDQEKIFEMFQTLESGPDMQSTGVGLAIVKKIIQGIGGNVWVESEPEKGATFFFTIPAEIIKQPSNASA